MIFWVGLVKNGDSLLVRETLKYAYLMNKLLNWADFLNADSDAYFPKITNKVNVQKLVTYEKFFEYLYF